MLYAMLAACATLIFVLALAVPHAAEARRLARLFRAQQKWAEMTERQAMPASRSWGSSQGPEPMGRWLPGRRGAVLSNYPKTGCNPRKIQDLRAFSDSYLVANR